MNFGPDQACNLTGIRFGLTQKSRPKVDLQGQSTHPYNASLFYERGQLDLTGSYQINNISAFFEARNLTNSTGVRYYGDRDRVLEYEKFGYSLFGGVRLKL
ncbi:hypothetical protein P7B02_13350 [Caulobacter segnis]|uniref:hypothetical protein n=1 Tax=Caulobacter segnis TaxID=88688 RepID=UPI0024107843|nr:hypothetical protein [Caulobacter segnis]MDG2522531.1 hypothetical protein [Caulobacter segnis]